MAAGVAGIFTNPLKGINVRVISHFLDMCALNSKNNNNNNERLCLPEYIKITKKMRKTQAASTKYDLLTKQLKFYSFFVFVSSPT